MKRGIIVSKSVWDQKVELCQPSRRRGWQSSAFWSDPLFSKLGLLKFNDILTTNVCEFVAKFFKDELPKSFDNILKSLRSNRAAKLLVNIPKFKQLENFPSIAFPKIWNSQKDDIRLPQSLKSMKNKLKNQALAQYKTFKCQKSTCYSCKRN